MNAIMSSWVGYNIADIEKIWGKSDQSYTEDGKKYIFG